MSPNKKTTSNWILYFFIFTLVFHLVAIYYLQNEVRFISKGILMPLLTWYYLIRTNQAPAWKHRVTTALLFSWIGDIALMFEEKDPMFFLVGLSSFLIAHLWYISFFHKIRIKEKLRSRWPLMILVVAYYCLLLGLLYPHLGDMKIAVPVYGLVISFMLLLALHLAFISNKRAGMLMMMGAILFVISDSILAINKFYQPFDLAGLLIMLTYGLAQICLVLGAEHYLSPSGSKTL